MKTVNIQKLVYAGVCLALCMVLPLLTMNLQELGNALCPMHIPVFLCGFLCGGPYGLFVGLVSPFLRFLIFSKPELFPYAISMSLELATYGALSGFLYGKMKKNLKQFYFILIVSMLSGRVVWGLARFLLAKTVGVNFTFSMFLTGGFVSAVPGICIQLFLIPMIVFSMKHAGLIPGAGKADEK